MKVGESHRGSGNIGDEFLGPAGFQTQIFLSVDKSQYQLRYAGSSCLLVLLISLYKICIRIE